MHNLRAKPLLVISSKVREISVLFPIVARDYSFWVYIMTNAHNSVLYIGMTNSLDRRVYEHRQGDIPGLTADYRCYRLIYWEHDRDVRDAIAREKQLKKWSRAKKVSLINTMNPRWLDLSDEILGEE